MEQPEIKRPWGGYTILQKTGSHWMKKLYIHKGSRTSLQSHELRDEIWYVLKGNIIAQVGGKDHKLKTGDVVYIPKNKKHRLTGLKSACVLEVAYGTVLETDIIRYEDDYGRMTV